MRIILLVPNLRKWIKDIEEVQTVRFKYPLLADPELSVLRTVRKSVFNLTFIILICFLVWMCEGKFLGKESKAHIAWVLYHRHR